MIHPGHNVALRQSADYPEKMYSESLSVAVEPRQSWTRQDGQRRSSLKRTQHSRFILMWKPVRQSFRVWELHLEIIAGQTLSLEEANRNLVAYTKRAEESCQG